MLLLKRQKQFTVNDISFVLEELTIDNFLSFLLLITTEEGEGESLKSLPLPPMVRYVFSKNKEKRTKFLDEFKNWHFEPYKEVNEDDLEVKKRKILRGDKPFTYTEFFENVYKTLFSFSQCWSKTPEEIASKYSYYQLTGWCYISNIKNDDTVSNTNKKNYTCYENDYGEIIEEYTE